MRRSGELKEVPSFDNLPWCSTFPSNARGEFSATRPSCCARPPAAPDRGFERPDGARSLRTTANGARAGLVRTSIWCCAIPCSPHRSAAKRRFRMEINVWRARVHRGAARGLALGSPCVLEGRYPNSSPLATHGLAARANRNRAVNLLLDLSRTPPRVVRVRRLAAELKACNATRADYICHARPGGGAGDVEPISVLLWRTLRSDASVNHERPSTRFVPNLSWSIYRAASAAPRCARHCRFGG